MATLVQQDIVLAELPREAGPLIEVFQVVAVYLVLLPSGSTAAHVLLLLTTKENWD
jgi:hypothetical protein